MLTRVSLKKDEDEGAVMKVNESTIHKTELIMAVIVMVVLAIGYVVSRI